MFCNKCGQQLADGTKFCTKCGSPLNGNVIENNVRLELTSDEKSSLMTKAAIKAILIILPIALFITFITYEFGDGIIGLPVFLVGYPVLCVINYRKLKQKLLNNNIRRRL